jgi:hypothetical protein
MFDNTQPADQTGTPEVKFKVGDREYDVQTAATKIQHADTHISTLESELKSLREQLALTEAQKKAFEAMSSQPPVPPAPAQTNAFALDRDAFLAEAEQRVFDKLSRQQQDAIARSNLEAATAEAKRVYGDSYQQVLLERGGELGMSKEEIMSFAAAKPEAFKRLFNLSSTPQRGQMPPSSSYRPAASDLNDPIKTAALTAIDRKASGRQRTEAIALALKQAKY